MTGAGEEGGFFDALSLGPVAASDPQARTEQMLGGDLVTPQGQRP
jgi:conjugal transfer pilus assembly protein TraF